MKCVFVGIVINDVHRQRWPPRSGSETKPAAIIEILRRVYSKTAMGDDGIRVTVSMPLLDFTDYVYSETITVPKFEQKRTSKFGFQKTTSITNKLIVLAEQHYTADQK